MKKRLTIVLLPLLLAGCFTGETLNQWLGIGGQAARNLGYTDSAKMAEGIRQALSLGSERAGASLSREDGYALAGYPVSLPPALQPVADTLKRVGMGSYVARLETAMNRGVEQAAAEAVPVFKNAISNMSVTDALAIVQGGDSAATDYFRGQTEAGLRQRYQPIIRDNLDQTGFYSQYRALLNAYNALPLTSKPNLDIEQQLLDHSLNALFGRLAEEERQIRAAPLARGSELIGAVFGL